MKYLNRAMAQVAFYDRKKGYGIIGNSTLIRKDTLDALGLPYLLKGQWIVFDIMQVSDKRLNEAKNIEVLTHE